MYLVVASFAALVVWEGFDHLPLAGWGWTVVKYVLIALILAVGEASDRQQRLLVQARRERRLQAAVDESVRLWSPDSSSERHTGWYALRREHGSEASISIGPRSPQPTSLVLYLRPFRIDNTQLVDGSDFKSLLAYILPMYPSPSALDIDDAIHRSLSEGVELVAIGARGDDLGAARIVTPDETWKQYFSSLALQAEFVVSIPSLHRSTHWELQQLARERQFAKVVMVVTPMHLGAGEPLLAWGSIRDGLAQDGWTLPETVTPWETLLFDAQGVCRRRLRAHNLTPKLLKRAFMARAEPTI